MHYVYKVLAKIEVQGFVCVAECRDEKVEIKEDELAGSRFSFIFRDAE